MSNRVPNHASIIRLRKLFLFILLIFPLISCHRTKPQKARDYRTEFGKDYEFAEDLIRTNSWWADSIASPGTDPDFALAIVFPELIRYSSIVDFMEVRGLEVLYVQYGDDYADFSIGYFQMKPSFAERIESDILKYSLIKLYPELSGLNPTIDHNQENRKQRIMRLRDEHCQLLYLEAFIRIMDTLYPEKAVLPAREKLRFYSTAYNTGYFKGERKIGEENEKKRFYVGMVAGRRYNYADIAEGYFEGRGGFH